jgi:hypothetical protein
MDDVIFYGPIGVASVIVIGLVVLLAWMIASVIWGPQPTCPDGLVLAGGGYAGAYHCIPGVAPVYR